ncbi:MAG: hypothetical protein ACLUL2_06220 [Blautia sp.]
MADMFGLSAHLRTNTLTSFPEDRNSAGRIARALITSGSSLPMSPHGALDSTFQPDLLLSPEAANEKGKPILMVTHEPLHSQLCKDGYTF